MHSLQACAAACGPYAQCISVGVCIAVASPREPSHSTAVALRGDRSAQCTCFRHQRRRVRAFCAMHTVSGFAPQLHPHETLLTAPQLL